MDFSYITGQTPLDEAEKREMIPSIATREELDAWEQQNIIEAREWLMRKATLARKVEPAEAFLLDLHRRMFRRVWRWAGQYRRTDKNIGVPFWEIPVHLRQLLDDAAYWQEHGTYSARAFAVIFHHRLVKIHLFANGNGRHSRLCADALIAKAGEAPLSWGGGDLTRPVELRDRYIAALKAADGGDYAPLLAFADA